MLVQLDLSGSDSLGPLKFQRRAFLADCAVAVKTAKQLQQQTLESIFQFVDSSLERSLWPNLAAFFLFLSFSLSLSLQRIFNSFVYTEKTSNGETEVQQLAKKIREKFNRYLDVVNRNKQVVEASYTAHLTSPLTAIQDCCSIPASMMEFDGNFNTNVSKTICCDRLSPTVNSRAFNPGRDLNSVLADNLKSNPGIKWQYFSSEEGIFTVFPAHKFHCKGNYEHRSRSHHLWEKKMRFFLDSSAESPRNFDAEVLRPCNTKRGKGKESLPRLAPGTSSSMSPE
ncbi:hypothetical protein ATANTOWER_027183 [Ataeniobius toweri]|uniref:Uncharacterized protein n=1 Tax=Ataeniobius toweri TaxID=208326 RepID=A0ABU7C4Q6_9TELE|nr:hypothetical protein [Ataeniobius toweri]